MSEARFAADSSLQALARRLRLLGFDVTVLEGARLERVCEAARLEGRVVLTLSRRVPPACARCGRFVVARGDEESSLRDIVARYAPSGPPFSRCAHCNTLLVAAGDGAARSEAPLAPPPGVTVTGHCPTCRRCYWHGSHVDRLREWFQRVLGVSVPAPGG